MEPDEFRSYLGPRLVRSGTWVLLGPGGPASEHACAPPCCVGLSHAPCCAGLSHAAVVVVARGDFVQRDGDALARPYRLGNVLALGLGSDHDHGDFDLAAGEALAGLV
jgi:hypothetical protein